MAASGPQRAACKQRRPGTRMAPPRLFVDQPLSAGTDVVVHGDAARHAGRVLRCRPGDALTLFDGRGGEYAASIRQVTKGALELRVDEHRDGNAESPVAIHLAQGLARGDRMDTVIQKATELGVARITPLAAEFSVVRLTAARAASRVEHWRRVAIAACEQCGRNSIPIIDSPATLAELLKNQPPDTPKLILEPGAAGTLAAVVSAPAPAEVLLLVGPEGGFSPEEIELARGSDCRSVDCGPRILRTETAAIVALALLQGGWGDLGPP